MKRILCLLTALIFAVTLAPAPALADDFDYETIPTPHMLVVDGNDSSHVFYERAADAQAYPASTTKIMTCILALEFGNLDDSVTVGEEVTPFTNYSSLMNLKNGETVTLRDLVYGLMLVSGNDAAAAIAVHVGGSIEGFVQKMNDKAASIGMTNTHFQNPHGVQNDNHYTTARDMAKLMAYALQNQEFCEIDRTATYTVPSTGKVLVTTNRMLKAVEGDPVNTVYPFAVGGKTGDTDTAGKCFVAVAEREGARVIIVLFGDKIDLYGGDKVTTNLARFVNAGAIFDHVFESDYAAVTGAELNLATAFSVPVANGRAADLTDGKLTATADIINLTIRALPAKINAYKASAAAITPEVVPLDGLAAPIIAGQSVGTVRYMLSGEAVMTAELVAANDVQADMAAGDPAPSDSASPFAATAEPLIDRGRKEWSTSDVLILVMVILIVLLVALVAVFVITERKRRYERKRRRAKARRRKTYE